MAKEIQETLAEKHGEFKTLTARINNLENADQAYREIEQKLEKDPDYQVPEPTVF